MRKQRNADDGYILVCKDLKIQTLIHYAMCFNIRSHFSVSENSIEKMRKIVVIVLNCYRLYTHTHYTYMCSCLLVCLNWLDNYFWYRGGATVKTYFLFHTFSKFHRCCCSCFHRHCRRLFFRVLAFYNSIACMYTHLSAPKLIHRHKNTHNTLYQSEIIHW